MKDHGEEVKVPGVYREGSKLVVREGARFPEHCAICSREGDAEAVDFTFARKQANVAEAAILQSAARAMSDLATGNRYTGPVFLQVPLCTWCRRRRLRVLGLGLGLLAIAVACFLIERAMGIVIIHPGELGLLDMSLINFIACGMILVGAILTLMATFDSERLWFKATKFYDRYVWVSGAGSSFIAQLPMLKDRHRLDRSGDASMGDPAHLSADELIRRGGNVDDYE